MKSGAEDSILVGVSSVLGRSELEEAKRVRLFCGACTEGRGQSDASPGFSSCASLRVGSCPSTVACEEARPVGLGPALRRKPPPEKAACTNRGNPGGSSPLVPSLHETDQR